MVLLVKRLWSQGHEGYKVSKFKVSAGYNESVKSGELKKQKTKSSYY